MIFETYARLFRLSSNCSILVAPVMVWQDRAADIMCLLSPASSPAAQPVTVHATWTKLQQAQLPRCMRCSLMAWKAVSAHT